MVFAFPNLFGWLKSPPAPRVRLTDNGFEVCDGNRTSLRVRWNDVREIFAFREGLHAGDRVCLGFRVKDGVDYYRVDDGEPGFSQLLERLPQVFSDFDPHLYKRLEGAGPDCCYVVLWRPAAPQQNRRAFFRRPAKAGVRVTCRRSELGSGPELAVALVDVAEGGGRVFLDAPLCQGEKVSLGFGGSFRAGRVAWVEGRGGGGYWAGIQLDTSLGHDDFHLLTDGDSRNHP